MKKFCFIIVLACLLAGSLWADISWYYNFVPSAGTYTAIIGTTVPGTVGDDVISTPIDIGFDFVYGLNTYSQIKICSNGYVTLGTVPGSTLSNYLPSTTYCPVLAPLWDDTFLVNPAEYLLTGTAPDRVLTLQFTGVRWNYSSTTNFNYQVKLYENSKVEFVYGANSSNPVSASASIGINMLPGGNTNFWSVTPGNPATASHTAANSQVAVWPGQGTVYSFEIVNSTCDVAALSLAGNTLPTQGMPADYTITIRNMSTVDLALGAYTVKLLNGTTELCSVMGPALNAQTAMDITWFWNPPLAGNVTLTGKVVLPGDTNPANDITAPLNLIVQPAGTIAVTIGDGSELARIPVDFFWRNSLFETIYYADEIGMPGDITGISFYSNFISALPNQPVNVWMGLTAANDLAAGWIPSTQLTQVYSGNVSFPSGLSNIYIPFTTPVAVGGANLALLVERPFATTDVFGENFLCQTIGTNRSRKAYSDATDFNPAAPPANSTLSGQFPRTSLYILAAGTGGCLNGTVTCGATPLAGVTVSLAAGLPVQTTSADGTYSFMLLTAATYTATFTKTGYLTQTATVEIIGGQTATLNVNLVAQPVVTVYGNVVGSDAPTVGLADATVTLSGILDYQGVTNAQGGFSLPNVLSENSYTYVISKAGYQHAAGSITVTSTDYNMNTVVLNELALPVSDVLAIQNPAHTAVNIAWSAPVVEGEWLHWDSGENFSSIGTGSVADFDIASRWTADDLFAYAGQSLYAVKFFPMEADCTYSIRVWTGGSATNPGALVADQVVSNPVIGSFNTVNLTTPVPIPPGQEMWFGVRCNATTGYPAGCDAGPAHNGLGNMMYIFGSWSTLYDLAPSMNYDWNLAGYVGSAVPGRIASLSPLPFDVERINSGTLQSSGRSIKTRSTPEIHNSSNTRSLVGYQLWRLTSGQENTPAVWTLLTPNPISETTFADLAWNGLPDGTYKWAAKAFYTNGIGSVAVFSNHVQRLTQVGYISGVVSTIANLPLSGAVVSTSGYADTTDTGGFYTMLVPSGTYSVTAVCAGYSNVSQNLVQVTTGQTTTVNFHLPVTNILTDDFESYPAFSVVFPLWYNLDQDYSATMTFEGYEWANMGAPQAFMVFEPGATLPPSTQVTGTPHSGNKMVVCWSAVNPPNNDWLMSRIYNIYDEASISFWAKSLTDEYGLDRFKVWYSTGSTNPLSFTRLSGFQYIEAPVEWTNYVFFLPQNVPGPVRIGIQCTSYDSFCLQIDDFRINLGVPNSDDTPAVSTILQACYPNPFTSQTTLSYSVKGTAPVSLEIFNLKGQKVRTLVNETKADGNYSTVWDGTDYHGKSVSDGVYFYKMTAGKYSATRKLILLK